ncbi:hypothetical protein PHYSODRAFT_308183 [Phytophthora sojae]|uniref:No apical meristem-associated C-terminal domain-containing protein n=1 Tax=Phytophthora sojae (strain P6497) TaxID=1094619 RepID=G5AIN6_PHYSP|nr:hypothetical protein PHYSODRAFT_305343 [Phytophthora sojae]XP_009539937.1 hypothetical protein PHYSODRAFT_308183 [Phytophthora sojae]EGZ04646.1 hypothetical protein PHYSODRAFT_308183 [Phytophthora sojae]EGZ10036.1 hypothetical protein PHYSODRAFT_305343 [Phytophthora sojae]|eukprot:XP_009534897.1 hypothetical protein PHYSODRAFT_305343 [Phytophthora sojae]
MCGKKRKTRSSTHSVSTTARTSSEADFTPAEQECLSRAWIKVVEESTGYDDVQLTREIAKDLNDEIGRSFWEWVRDEYSGAGTEERARSVYELHAQWLSILPSLVEFLTLFCDQWVGSCLSSQEAEASQEEAFSSARNAFQEEHGRPFSHEVTVRLLVNHAKWGTLVKPLLVPDEDLSEEVGAATPNKLSALSREEPKDEEAGAAANDPPPRRVRQRRSDTEADSTDASLSRLNEAAEEKRLEVMERQLEVEIMTYNEDGLSAEAVEYLRLQRSRILRKVRLQAGQQGHS